MAKPDLLALPQSRQHHNVAACFIQLRVEQPVVVGRNAEDGDAQGEAARQSRNGGDLARGKIIEPDFVKRWRGAKKIDSLLRNTPIAAGAHIFESRNAARVRAIR